MGTILGSTLINRAARELFDTNNVNWSRTELLGWLNDGQRQIVMLVPESSSLQRITMALSAGSEQTIPADGWMLISINRNMGTNGATPGRAIRLVDRKQLDAFNPDWHSSTQVTAPRNWIFDPQSPTQFWVNPPSDGTGQVEINYSQVPADLANETLAITLNDIFETPLVDYMLYRAYGKRFNFGDPTKSSACWEAFRNALASKAKAEITNDPNQALGHPPPDEAGVPR